MSNKTSSSSGGIGFAGLLTVAFIVLKLCGVIAWSWWWVLSPLWISFSLFLIIVACITALAIYLK
jgi:Flp pilus assembly protein TadB